ACAHPACDARSIARTDVVVKRLASCFVLVACSQTTPPPDSGSPGSSIRPAVCPQPAADLCADFGSGSNPAAGFTNANAKGSASGAIESRSMLVTVPSTSQTASAYAPYFETTNTLGEARITFAFRADTLPAILTVAVVAYQQDQYAAALQIA